jgi:hypothetical protein
VCGEGSNAFDACTVMRGQKVECTSWPERYAWPERRIQHKTMSDAWHLPGPHSDSESSDKEELPSPPSASGRVLPSSGLASWRTTSMPHVPVLPLELMVAIATCVVEPRQLCVMRILCRKWQQVISSMWRRLALQRFPRLNQLLALGSAAPETVSFEQIYREQLAAEAVQEPEVVPLALSQFLLSIEFSAHIVGRDREQHSLWAESSVHRYTTSCRLRLPTSSEVGVAGPHAAPPFYLSLVASESMWPDGPPQWLQDWQAGNHQAPVFCILDRMWMTRDLHTVCVYADGSPSDEVIYDGLTFFAPQELPLPNQLRQYTLDNRSVTYESADTFAMQPDLHETTGHWDIYITCTSMHGQWTLDNDSDKLLRLLRYFHMLTERPARRHS